MASPLIPEPDASPPSAGDLPERPYDPVATALSTSALAPYIGLLPGAVLDSFALLIDVTLAQHPVGTMLSPRPIPGRHAATQTPPDPPGPDFQGYPTVRVLRARLAKVRKAPRAPDDQRFLLPDVSLAVLDAFVCYLGDDTDGAGLDPAAREELAGLLCDGMAACLFLGLVEDLEARPEAAAVWADTGRVLLAMLPRCQAILRAAREEMPRADRGFLEGYKVCAWDQARMAKRVKCNAVRVHGRCAAAILSLGRALRAELGGDHA